MTYNLKKYQSKRERVLGIHRRGVSFGLIVGLGAIGCLIAVGFMVVPKSVAWFNGRNLDDAIFKMHSAEVWPQTAQAELRSLAGVKNVVTDKQGTRLVVTFDRTLASIEKMTALFQAQGLKIVLLNRLEHRPHHQTQQEDDYETL